MFWGLISPEINIQTKDGCFRNILDLVEMPRKAYEEEIIVGHIPLTVESLEVWGNKIIVGTNQGTILQYDVLPKQMGQGGNFQVQIKDPLKNFSKKAILQLGLIRESSSTPLLISITDGLVQLHYLPTFKLFAPLQKSKGCHLFAVNETSETVMIACAFRKKILIYNLERGHFPIVRELNVGEPARSLDWCGGHLCVGMKNRYQMIDIQNNTAKDLPNAPLRGAIPSVTLLPDKLLVSIEKNIGAFLDFNGRPTDKWGITWSDSPVRVAYHYPYVLGILQKHVEVQSLFEGTKFAVQQIPIRAKILLVKGDYIYVASQKEIWCLIPIPLVDQIDELVRIKSYDEALSLLKHLPAQVGNEDTKAEQMKHIRFLCANHLFERGQYDASMDLFIELNCNPQKVLRLFPNMLPRRIQELQDNKPIRLEGYSELAALQALIKYLQYVRDPSPDVAKGNLMDDYESTNDLNEIIDTSMLRACIQCNDTAIYDLLGGPNRCNLKESVKMLTDATRTGDLVRLYRTKGMHQKALEILTNLSKKRGTGTDELIAYLKGLGREHIDLILKYSVWPLEQTPAEGIELFMENRSEEDELPPHVVLNHIKRLSKDAAKKITIPYLEWLIHERHETNADFHNELVLEYLTNVLEIKKRSQQNGNHYVRAGEERGRLGEIRKLLVDFLDSSKHYTAEKLLPTFMCNDLYEERAILLSRLKQHKEALNTHVHHLGDNRLAEEYCDKHYDEESPDSRDVYLYLLTVYLQPPEGSKPNLEAALKLVNKHYAKINAAKALNLLPSEIPIYQMYEYFEAVLRNLAEKKRNNQVISQLLRSENLQVREEMIHETSPPIKMDEDTDCPVCGRSIPGSSAFAHYPNGTVTHFGCCKDPHVCPKTGTVFGKPELK